MGPLSVAGQGAKGPTHTLPSSYRKGLIGDAALGEAIFGWYPRNCILQSSRLVRLVGEGLQGLVLFAQEMIPPPPTQELVNSLTLLLTLGVRRASPQKKPLSEYNG